MKIWITALILVCGLAGTTASWDAWGHSETITLQEQSGSALEDYQVGLDVDTASLIADGRMRTDCGDIRFADSTGTEIPYWIESGCNSASTRIWVRVPSIPTSGTTISLHYGNPDAASASSGEDTFIFFDDFDDGEWSGRWLQSRETGDDAYATIDESGGKIAFTGCSMYDPAVLMSKDVFRIDSEGFVLDTEFTIATDGAGQSTTEIRIVGESMYADPMGPKDLHYGVAGNSYSGDNLYIWYPVNNIVENPGLFTYALGEAYRHVVRYDGSAGWDILVYGADGSLLASTDGSAPYSDSAALRLVLYVVSPGSHINNVKVRRYAYPEPAAYVAGEEMTVAEETTVEETTVREETTVAETTIREETAEDQGSIIGSIMNIIGQIFQKLSDLL